MQGTGLIESAGAHGNTSLRFFSVLCPAEGFAVSKHQIGIADFIGSGQIGGIHEVSDNLGNPCGSRKTQLPRSPTKRRRGVRPYRNGRC